MAESAGAARTGHRRVHPVRIERLVRGYSPRSAGEVAEHARLLAESGGPLPPILVHRATMRVIDGMHRLQAARLRGDDTIEVEFFEGDEADAFVAAVQANITHGLPLSLSDREAAAERLITMFPERSDRWHAGVVGLARGTIGAIRARVSPPEEAPVARVGRDGKVRPLSSARARQVASELIAARPDASLREVARVAGLSPTTVRDVRERMRRGDDPVPEVRGEAARAARDLRTAVRREDVRDVGTLLRILSHDPALRSRESGREVLRWLSVHARAPLDGPRVVEAIPPHCAYLVAELATRVAEEWSALAGELERRLAEDA